MVGPRSQFTLCSMNGRVRGLGPRDIFNIDWAISGVSEEEKEYRRARKMRKRQRVLLNSHCSSWCRRLSTGVLVVDSGIIHVHVNGNLDWNTDSSYGKNFKVLPLLLRCYEVLRQQANLTDLWEADKLIGDTWDLMKMDNEVHAAHCSWCTQHNLEWDTGEWQKTDVYHTELQWSMCHICCWRKQQQDKLAERLKFYESLD
jgi:hypothetical protein